MCSFAYGNKSINKLEIQTLLCYNMSFYLSNEASFELVASAVAGKTMSKMTSRQSSFHKIAILCGLSRKCQCRLLP